MNRLTRITAILIQLQSKRIVTAKEIAYRYKKNRHTGLCPSDPLDCGFDIFDNVNKGRCQKYINQYESSSL